MFQHTSLLVFTICLPLLLFANSDRCQSIRFKNVVIFGDSYTDTDRVYKLSRRTWPASPPYYHGRFSNGPNWVDQLKVSHVKNYAYGGATTDNNLVQGYAKFGTIKVPGLRQQVEIFSNERGSSKLDPARTLYILWITGNDFFFNSSLAAAPEKVINSLLNSVKDLISFGAKNILLFNLFPGQYIPAAIAMYPAQLLSQVTAFFNAKLNVLVKEIQNLNPQINLDMFNINSLLTKIFTTNSDYFTNASGSCWNVTSPTSIQKNCQDPNKYAFLDDRHFSSNVHGLIAEPIHQYLLPSYQLNTATCYVFKP
ncbi:hypothetical protein I4U23_004244 [Adineta vaga]|nr:hypothetical protein I4U23_004244 [Adineta vaga]